MEIRKTCSTCGADLKFNSTTGFYECSFCGIIHKPGVDNRPQSMETVDAFMRAKRYDDARHVLDKLIKKEPNNPYFVLRDILFEQKMMETHILLGTAKHKKEILEEVMNSSRWDELKKVLPSESSSLPDDIRDYCRTAIEMVGMEEELKDSRTDVELSRNLKNPGKKELHLMENVRLDVPQEKPSEDLYDSVVSIMFSFPIALLLFGFSTYFLAHLFLDVTASVGVALVMTLLGWVVVSIFLTNFRKRRRIAKNEEGSKEEQKLRADIEKYKAAEEKQNELLDKIRKIENRLRIGGE